MLSIFTILARRHLLISTGHKSKNWTNWNFDLKMALDEKRSLKVIQFILIIIYPLGTIHVQMCQINPFNSCWGTSLSTQNVNVMVALQEDPGGGHQSHHDASSMDYECLNQMSWQFIDSSIFQSEPKWADKPNHRQKGVLFLLEDIFHYGAFSVVTRTAIHFYFPRNVYLLSHTPFREITLRRARLSANHSRSRQHAHPPRNLPYLVLWSGAYLIMKCNYMSFST